MIRRFSINFALLSMFLDAALLVAALYLVATFRPFMDEIFFWIPFVRPIQNPLAVPWPLYLVMPLVWGLSLFFSSVYDGRKNLRLADEFSSLTLGSGIAIINLAGLLYFSYRDVSRLFFIVFAVLAYAALLAWRILWRAYSLRRGKKENIHRVLIVGAGLLGHTIQEEIKQYPHTGACVVGFLDDDPKKEALQPDVLGSTGDALAVIRRERVQDVVIALPLSAQERINQMIALLADQPVKVWVAPDYAHLALHHAAIEMFAGIPLLDLRAPALSDSQRMLKRLFDVLLTSLALLPTLPLMAVIALLIRLFDGPPVLFRQQRVGENGHLFEIYKFRTMRPDAEALFQQVALTDEQGNLIHKHPDDPRVTRLGRFLRRWSLDELPQLFNVLAGNMSLVGPRPELPALVEKYEPWQRKRFAVPQGITGWWQIHGRSDKPMHLHTEYDLYYIQNYSIWLDVQIIFKTIWIILRGKGAY
jgi:exopolysaccharide biosynthesis polyprenyl glycosylphosphotransferase